MKQLLILSGKGGTGKTTVASALIKLSHARYYGDCDVDAPNLHLSLHQTVEPVRHDFYGMDKAIINPERCIGCGICQESCRFGAIQRHHDNYKVVDYNCEGCGVCEMVCPAGAVSMAKAKAGDLELYKDDQIFSTATLKMGSGNSGKLVADVKKQLKTEADTLVIVDGSPGIGCPVIASMSGADMVLIVTEPTLSGFSDMERILETAATFHMRTAVCINKYDINVNNTEQIEAFCYQNDIPVVGKIPYDHQFVTYLNQGKHVVDDDGFLRDIFKTIYKTITTMI